MSDPRTDASTAIDRLMDTLPPEVTLLLAIAFPEKATPEELARLPDLPEGSGMVMASAPFLAARFKDHGEYQAAMAMLIARTAMMWEDAGYPAERTIEAVGNAGVQALRYMRLVEGK